MIGLFVFLNKDEFPNFLTGKNKINGTSVINLITHNGCFDEEKLPPNPLKHNSKAILVVARDVYLHSMKDGKLVIKNNWEEEFKKLLDSISNISKIYIVFHARGYRENRRGKEYFELQKQKDIGLQRKWILDSVKANKKTTVKEIELSSTGVKTLKRAINRISDQQDYEKAIYNFINKVFHEILNDFLTLLHTIHFPSSKKSFDDAAFKDLKEQIISNNYFNTNLKVLEDQLDAIWKKFQKECKNSDNKLDAHVTALSSFRDDMFKLLENENLLI